MTYSDTSIADKTFEDRKITLSFEDNTASGRYDEMMKDFYKSVIGEKENPYSYEHELMVQRTLYRVTGEN